MLGLMYGQGKGTRTEPEPSCITHFHHVHILLFFYMACHARVLLVSVAMSDIASFFIANVVCPVLYLVRSSGVILFNYLQLLYFNKMNYNHLLTLHLCLSILKNPIILL